MPPLHGNSIPGIYVPLHTFFEIGDVRENTHHREGSTDIR
jgi:hypothetical protein